VRIVVGIPGVLLSLPWFVVFGVFQQNFPPRDRRRVAGLVFGLCVAIAAGSVFIPSWYHAAVGVLLLLWTCSAALVVARQLGQRARDRKQSGRSS
jgi:peptidoglycan/LPS O-acetylase OafA/YrhL